MAFIRNWKIRTKIVSLIIVTIIFISAIGSVGYYYNLKANTQMRDIYSKYLAAKYLDNCIVESLSMENQFSMYLYLILSDLEKIQDNFEKSLADFSKLPTDKYIDSGISEIKQNLELFRTESQKVSELKLDGDPKEAIVILNRIRYLLIKLQDYEGKLAEKTYSQNVVDFTKAKAIITVLPIVSLLILLILGIVIANLISNAIRSVLINVDQIAVGNLAIEDIKIKSNDESGLLSIGFNTMKINIQSLVKQLADSSEQVAASSEELTALAQQTSEASHHISSIIDEVAMGTEEQSQAVNDISSTIEQISASTQQVAATSSVISDSMEKTLITTRDGQEAIYKVIEQMKSIRSGTDGVQKTILELASSSNEIGEIIQVIADITNQTNLLALNAAIEAARAGEKGRGFAVVAEEVRKLAEQSREAAKQIGFIINRNQVNIDTAVSAMKIEVNDVKVGIEVVNTAGEAFEEIIHLIQNVSIQIQEISSSIQQVASGSKNMVSSVRNVDNISKNTANQAQMVSSGVEEQTISMEQISLASQNLAAMAQVLQGAVNKFII